MPMHGIVAAQLLDIRDTRGLSPPPSQGIVIDFEHGRYFNDGVAIAVTDVVGSGTLYQFETGQLTVNGYEHNYPTNPTDGFKLIGPAADLINDPGGFVMVVTMHKSSDPTPYYVTFTDDAETFVNGIDLRVAQNIAPLNYVSLRCFQYNGATFHAEPSPDVLMVGRHVFAYRSEPATAPDIAFAMDVTGVQSIASPTDVITEAGVDACFVTGNTGDITLKIELYPASLFDDADLPALTA